jgi:hypothetical protein
MDVSTTLRNSGRAALSLADQLDSSWSDLSPVGALVGDLLETEARLAEISERSPRGRLLAIAATHVLQARLAIVEAHALAGDPEQAEGSGEASADEQAALVGRLQDEIRRLCGASASEAADGALHGHGGPWLMPAGPETPPARGEP